MNKAINLSRREDLKTMLDQRRHDLRNEVHERMRTIRGGGPAAAHRAGVDASETSIHEDLELAVIQIHAEMVATITAALARLDEGDYGRCQECGEEISEKRLRALPFATCCRDCQEAVEVTERRTRHLEEHGASLHFGGLHDS
jgi:RNA polymerase-binding transcription factor